MIVNIHGPSFLVLGHWAVQGHHSFITVTMAASPVLVPSASHSSGRVLTNCGNPNNLAIYVPHSAARVA